MSQNLVALYGREYATNVELLLQQMGSKLAGTVDTGSYKGDQASPVDQLGAVEATVVTSRFAPITRTDALTDRRWVFPTDYHIPQQIDNFDKLRLLSDPQSKYVTNAVLGLGRKKDLEICQAFTGTAKTGTNGGTSTIFTAANEVDVNTGGTNTRINFDKIRAVKELMMAKHIDFDYEEAYIGITAKDHSALLNEVQLTSTNFKGGDAPVLQSGKITEFLGFKFVHCELIETVMAGTNEVTLPVWVKSGMHLGMWNDITVHLSERNDLTSIPWQAYCYMTIGATRLEENKVYAIESYRA